MVSDRLVTPKTYAELCGLKAVQSIYARISAGKITPTVKTLAGIEVELIDVKKYPPTRKRKSGGGRKPRS